MALLAQVIIPLAVGKRFTYTIPEGMTVKVGSLVIVGFGAKKILSALVVQITEGVAENRKPLLAVLGDRPLVLDKQIGLWTWISEYYLCSEGEVMAAALPSGLRLSSDSFLQPNPALQDKLTPTEQAILARFSAPMPYEKAFNLIRDTLGKEDQTLWGTELQPASQSLAFAVLKSLLDKGALLSFEKIREKYTPKVQRRVRLTARCLSAESLSATFAALSKKPKQETLLLRYLSLSKAHTDPAANAMGICKDTLLGEDRELVSALDALVKKKVLEIFTHVVPRFELADVAQPKTIQLSAEQKAAFAEIIHHFEQKDVVLLHGVTGSGKTEIYIELATCTLREGRQVLILVPEIALTVQTLERFHQVFGSRLGVYHSKFSDRERVEIWQGVLQGQFPVVIGVRSAVFLPFSNLGLIVVDEEHDTSYKQADPAPRYHARDTAIKLAALHQAKVLLGSATPSLESWHNAKQNRYGYIHLKSRFGNSPMPQVVFADLKAARKGKSMRGDFSPELLTAISRTHKENLQTILFLNRRGYCPQLQCLDCGYIPQCPQCSVSQTFHLADRELRCHYCGQHQPGFSCCPQCASPKIKTIGTGTEKIEDDLKLFMPELRVARMDFDSTRSKKGVERIIEEFSQRNIDVLTGTQMVTKGLDFEGVGLVGIIDADRMLHFPDFRAHERAFQLMVQVAGRAGRRNQQGQVIIQTSQPGHFVLRCVENQDFEAFYNWELRERRKFDYPPFTRLVRLTVKAAEPSACIEAANRLADRLKIQLGKAVTDPGVPPIERIRGLYIREIYIRLPKTAALHTAKTKLAQIVAEFTSIKDFGKLIIKIDVDPV